MNVTFNEPVIERLLQSREGPVGRYLNEGAQRIVVDAERHLNEIVRGSFQPEVTYEITDADGLRAEIKMARSGSTSQRLMRKLARADEPENWLTFMRRAFGR